MLFDAEFWSIIGSVTSSNLVTFFLTKKKYNQEVENSVLTNLEKSIGIYKDILDSVKKELEETRDEVRHLKAKQDEADKRATEERSLLQEKIQTLNLVLENTKADRHSLQQAVCYKLDCKFRKKNLDDDKGDK